MTETSLPKTFQPRRQLRARSQKPSTMRTRYRELHRKDLSTALLRLKTKWRYRRMIAKQKVEHSEHFSRLKQITPMSSQKYLDRIDVHFNELRDMEIRDVTMLWNNHLSGSRIAMSKVISNQDVTTHAHIIQPHSKSYNLWILDPDGRPFHLQPNYINHHISLIIQLSISYSTSKSITSYSLTTVNWKDSAWTLLYNDIY